MSDDILSFVPRDPRHIPAPDAQQRALMRLRALLPDAVSFDTEQSELVRFHDCGENFESISCPHCSADLPLDWWSDAMGADFDGGGFRLDATELPCCQATGTLNELRYDWPQAFGRFSISVRNPDIGSVPDTLLRAIEAELGCALIVVRQRI